MSKIHLVIDYKQDQNKYLVLFISNITDYAYRSNAFLSVCKHVRELFYKDESISPINICQILLNQLFQKLAEKGVEVTFMVYVAMSDLVLYMHRYPHGKQNKFICEKAMFLEVNDKTKLTYDDILTIASLVLPVKFKFAKNSKNADSILLSNTNSIFFEQKLLASKQYAVIQTRQKEVVDEIEAKFGIKVVNVFCIE